jgi:PAS domain S-box-containing protein
VRFSAEVFDSLPIGLAMRDLQGRYVFVNRAWEGFVGARREDVIGKTVHDRAPKAEADAVVAEDRAALARGPGRPTELKDFVYGERRFMLTRTRTRTLCSRGCTTRAPSRTRCAGASSRSTPPPARAAAWAWARTRRASWRACSAATSRSRARRRAAPR